MEIVERKDCTACGACVEVCPKEAISLQKDKHGFLNATVDDAKCVRCQLCKKVCPALNYKPNNIFVQKVLAVTSLDDTSKNSSSGGLFAIFAKTILSEGGVVFATTLTTDFKCKVVKVEDVEALISVQGSKYIQSNMTGCFKEIKKILQTEKTVLFCGTPCQCSALKNFLGEGQNNLYLLDLVCHGVPNNDMFEQSMAVLQKKYKKPIIDFKFRDKKYGQGTTGSVSFQNGKEKKIKSYQMAYYDLFLSSELFRDSCYQCKYATDFRVGDITIFDYWGVEKNDSKFIKDCKEKRLMGISGMIINSEKGKKLFEKNKNSLFYVDTTIDNVKEKNRNLSAPSIQGKHRQILLEIYAKDGWNGIEKYYRRKYWLKNIIRSIYDLCPHFIKKLIVKLKR